LAIALARTKETDLLNPLSGKFWEFKLLNNPNYTNAKEAYQALYDKFNKHI
jgi:hypothetical protein